MIDKAIEKINAAMQKDPDNRYMEIVGHYIIDRCVDEENSIDFVKHTVLPIIVQREQEDSRKLLLPRERTQGLRIKREPKQLLRGDTEAQAAWYKAMREVGAYSVDDIRALEDLETVPGGDSYQASLNYVPLNLWAELSLLRALQGRQSTEEE